MIKIDYKVEVPDKTGASYQHINGDFVNSSLSDGNLEDNSINIQDGKFGDVTKESWFTNSSELTKGKVNIFNVKTFSQVGPYGFFHNNEKGSKVKAPIRQLSTLPEINDVNIEQDGDYLIYDISGEITEYDNIRLQFSEGDRRFDFIVNQPNGRIFKPYNMKGEFNYTARGYRNEIQEFSSPSSMKKIKII